MTINGRHVIPFVLTTFKLSRVHLRSLSVIKGSGVTVVVFWPFHLLELKKKIVITTLEVD
mgnify:FL=1